VSFRVFRAWEGRVKGPLRIKLLKEKEKETFSATIIDRASSHHYNQEKVPVPACE
jgi:hypothetical protein